MDKTCTFKFTDDDSNHRLLALLRKAKIRHDVDRDGFIHYSRGDEEIVGNELISSIRKRAFPAWQLLSCPKEYVERYRQYMTRHGIEFREEWINHQLCFLLPRKHRPHAWNLQDPGHPIKPRCNIAMVKRLCEILVENRRARTLGEEILRDLESGALGANAYVRLARWCNPLRSESKIQPIAQRISEELFGHVLRRVA
ncbi:MAG: hypothetical protein HY289_02850 [Planctomycetes bacterium]|nr:hypothetical protein [Planctomycetota bacterium]